MRTHGLAGIDCMDCCCITTHQGPFVLPSIGLHYLCILWYIFIFKCYTKHILSHFKLSILLTISVKNEQIILLQYKFRLPCFTYNITSMHFIYNQAMTSSRRWFFTLLNTLIFLCILTYFAKYPYILMQANCTVTQV